ncbi:hypothetical protein BT93_E1727 [Corymbia citriodora subsp. variegata]|nr:hypothetical protein BT93_E1727 [Corymbia citriodora subsp. variegata]
MVNWEELPQELLKLIAQRLAIEDFVAFGAVCSSWLSAATKETYNAKSKAPWLVTNVYKQMPEICSPSRGRTYPVDSRVGWAYTVHEYRIFNPLSRVSIKPPNLEKLRRDSLIRPTLRRGQGPRGRTLSLPIIESMALSGENAWRKVSPGMHPPSSRVIQLIYYDGLFVALDEKLLAMTLNEGESRMESRLVLEQKFKGRPYLVECSGSLLVAWDTAGTEGNRFQVFDVDLEKGTEEEVKSLGKASLFLNNSSFSMDFDAVSCLAGFKPNHIYFSYYFTHYPPKYNFFPDYANQEVEKKIYSMDSGKVETYSDVIGYSHAGQWFQPDF